MTRDREQNSDKRERIDKAKVHNVVTYAILALTKTNQSANYCVTTYQGEFMLQELAKVY